MYRTKTDSHISIANIFSNDILCASCAKLSTFDTLFIDNQCVSCKLLPILKIQVLLLLIIESVLHHFDRIQFFLYKFHPIW